MKEEEKSCLVEVYQDFCNLVLQCNILGSFVENGPMNSFKRFSFPIFGAHLIYKIEL